MKMHSIKLRILIPLAVALLALLAGFVVDSYKSERKHNEFESDEIITAFQHTFEAALKDDANLMMAVLHTFSDDKQLKAVFREKDRNKLLALTKPLFDRLRYSNNITHFYFTDTQRVNLLRVHKPERYGDVINRHTMITAEKTGEVSYGIELGPLGTFTLRVVKPFHDENGLIGYLELGEEIDHIISKISRAVGIDLYFSINKKYLSHEKWKLRMNTEGHNSDWSRFPNDVIIAQTLEEVPEMISDLFSDNNFGHDMKQSDVSMKDGRYFRSILLPLSDAKGTIVGNVIIMHDISTSIASIKNSIVFKSLMALTIGVILFTFFYIYINRVEAYILTKQVEQKMLYKELEETNEYVENNSKKLQKGFDDVTSHIDNVIRTMDHSVRMDNPHLKKCYEIKNCTKEDCACYGKEAMRCWKVAGTYCGGKVQGTFAQKYSTCSTCDVYKEATSEHIYQIGEQFNNMMHLLELKNIELESAYEELKATHTQMLQGEKMASIGQLAAGVAHEINNPTGFILSNLGTLDKYVNNMTEFINAQTAVIESMKADEKSEDLNNMRKKLKLDYIFKDIKELILESQDGADRIKKIVQNLKSFSRIDEAEYKPADINECIESTLNIVWNELKYNATVDKNYGELPLTKCFPQQLNQVFVNLLVNASHAIGAKGEIKIRSWNSDGTINVSISDTGCGIPEDKISKIFDPFFTTKDVGKGTGLGLSICYDIVKKHNGEITVESEEDKGTTFIVTLPVVEDKG